MAVALARARGVLSISDHEGRGLSFGFWETYVHFTLDHPKAKRSRHGEAELRRGPVDVLGLVISHGDDPSRAVWEDKSGDRLEAHLHEIAERFVLEAEAQYRDGLTQSYAWALKRRSDAFTELEKRRVEAARLAEERPRARTRTWPAVQRYGPPPGRPSRVRALWVARHP